MATIDHDVCPKKLNRAYLVKNTRHVNAARTCPSAPRPQHSMFLNSEVNMPLGALQYGMHALRTSQNWGSQNVQAVIGVKSISSGENFPICLPPQIHLAHFDPTTRLHSCSTPAGKHHDVQFTRMVFIASRIPSRFECLRPRGRLNVVISHAYFKKVPAKM
jgi:hypothetical protein